MLDDDVICAALQRVLGDARGSKKFELESTTKLDDVGVDSLLLAELIIELEDTVGYLLDLRPIGQLQTVRDLRYALRPIRSMK